MKRTHAPAHAAALASSASVADPLESIESRLRVRIVACAHALELPGKRIHGEWDPLLREIRIYDCNPSTADGDLVRAFVHELLHVTLEGIGIFLDESRIDAQASASAVAVSDTERAALAAALRCRAR